MGDLILYLEETIDRDPALYLSYILFAGYLLVVLAPEWLVLLEERCGIPRGYRVRTASDANAALDVAARHGPGLGLLILDVLMPEMGGTVLERRIAALGVTAPRLFVSGFAPGSHAPRDDVPHPLLQKPFTPEQLLGAVEQLLGRGATPILGN